MIFVLIIALGITIALGIAWTAHVFFVVGDITDDRSSVSILFRLQLLGINEEIEHVGFAGGRSSVSILFRLQLHVGFAGGRSSVSILFRLQLLGINEEIEHVGFAGDK